MHPLNDGPYLFNKQFFRHHWIFCRKCYKNMIAFDSDPKNPISFWRSLRGHMSDSTSRNIRNSCDVRNVRNVRAVRNVRNVRNARNSCNVRNSRNVP